jgi:hypothetical protein
MRSEHHYGRWDGSLIAGGLAAAQTEHERDYGRNENREKDDAAGEHRPAWWESRSNQAKTMQRLIPLGRVPVR